MGQICFLSFTVILVFIRFVVFDKNTDFSIKGALLTSISTESILLEWIISVVICALIVVINGIIKILVKNSLLKESQITELIEVWFIFYS